MTDHAETRRAFCPPVKIESPAARHEIVILAFTSHCSMENRIASFGGWLPMVIQFPTSGGKNRDIIGDRGLQHALLALTELVGNADTLFRPQFLGDKYPTIDLIVELLDSPGLTTPFFFAQVKATRLGYNQSGNLRVQITADTVNRLIAYPVPTYMIGVDNANRGRLYLLAALPGARTHYPSFPTTHRLDNEQTLRRLYDEVRTFWETNAIAFAASHFV